MPYNVDKDELTRNVPPPGQQEMDTLDLEAAKKKPDTSKTLRNGRYDGLKSFDELPPLKIDEMRPEKKHDEKYYEPLPEQSYAKHKRHVYISDEDRRKRRRGIIGGVIVLICVYIFSVAYIKNYNGMVTEELADELLYVDASALHLTENNYDKTVPYFDKVSASLNLYLADSDGDGLSDAFELAWTSSDAAVADSDGDGLSDGVEVLAGLGSKNPMTDGKTPDAQIPFERTLEIGNASLKAGGNANCFLTDMTASSGPVCNSPGVIGAPVEIDGADNSETLTLEFKVDNGVLSKWNSSPETLCVYEILSDGSDFRELDDVTTSETTVSVPIEKDGIYALVDSSLIDGDYNVNVFFLIDNSGSMYPEELCENSEENDVDFKRLDLTENIINEFNGSTYFGAAKFTQKYTRIMPLSTDEDKLIDELDKMRSEQEAFTGTEIAASLMRAADEFSPEPLNKNYIILITDGMPSVYNEAREQAAIEYCQKKNITVISIGLGKHIEPTYLSELSEKTNGMFFRVSNAEGLEAVYEKIALLIKDNQINVTDDGYPDMYVISDTGYCFDEDGMRFGVPTTESSNGMALGTAMINKKYYSGTLAMSESGYTSSEVGSVSGYDISSHEFFQDTRQDLSSLVLDCASAYEGYLAIKEKWDFAKVDDGLLKYSDETRSYISRNNMVCVEKDYFGEGENAGPVIKIFRTITFQPVVPYERYEVAALDCTKLTDSDRSIVDAIRYYDNIFSSDKAQILAFGANGDEAFSTLSEELTNGLPSVVTTGTQVYNVSRLLRENDNPNRYVLEAYNINSGSKPVKIIIERKVLFDDKTGTTCQYIAEIDKKTVPLYICTEAE